MPKILLVEDNEMNREMLSRRLLRKGYEVMIAVDGLQGVAMAVTELPDLILMDMSLPGIDGWEATRRIKADPSTRAIPVIALTAHAMSDDRARALAAGCDEFDTKPVDLARLLGKMESLLPTPGSEPTAPTDTPAPVAPTGTALTLPAVPASLPGFKTELEHFCMQAGLSARVQEDLQVVLDEVCANVFKHAYPPGQAGPLRLELRLDPGQPAPAFVLVFTDHGRPFNPLARSTPDLSLAWDERPIGGLGIHLVQTLSDRQSYRHSEADGNQLTLIKLLT
jgi:CheY-like chemotaxis protein